MKRIVLITSNELRHIYFANQLAKQLNIAGIVTEKKASSVSDFSAFTKDDQSIIQKHFTDRNKAENALLGECSFPESPLLELAHGGTNSARTLDWINEQEPDAIVLYGSSIIKEPILSEYEDKVINIHLGLSPYYRGSGTNFWPLVFNQPECVGGTIHLATPKVDAGNLLLQFRPDAAEGDGTQDLGTKVIIKGAELMPKVVNQYLSGKIIPQPQDLSIGRIFKTRDFNADAVRTMFSNFESGMITDYLLNRPERDACFPIVDTV